MISSRRKRQKTSFICSYYTTYFLIHSAIPQFSVAVASEIIRLLFQFQPHAFVQGKEYITV